MPESAPLPLDRTSPAELLARLDRELRSSDRVVPLEEERFLETHLAFEARSDQRDRIREWFLERVVPTIAADRPLRVLSIGSGSGELDLPLIEAFASRASHVRCIGINPNEFECAEFRSRFETMRVPHASLEVVPVGFEEFARRRDPSTPPYDLIHGVQSLYYMDDPATALEAAIEMLAPDGQCVLLHAPREELNELAARFYDVLYGRPTLFTREVLALVAEHGWPHRRERIDAWLDVTPSDPSDEIEPALRDFIAQVEVSRLPASAGALVVRYLRSVARRHDERLRIPHPVDAIRITRS